MNLSFYTERDYSGRFNLKAAEKKLMASALRRTKEVAKLANLLKKSEVEVLVGIIKHRLLQ